MELFAKLYSSLLVFVYHCFDRIVIHGYLSGVSRPEQVVYFFREVLGIPMVTKEALSRRTNEYRGWVEAYARNHHIPIEWAERGLRKEDYVLPALRRMEKNNCFPQGAQTGGSYLLGPIFSCGPWRLLHPHVWPTVLSVDGSVAIRLPRTRLRCASVGRLPDAREFNPLGRF